MTVMGRRTEGMTDRACERCTTEFKAYTDDCEASHRLCLVCWQEMIKWYRKLGAINNAGWYHDHVNAWLAYLHTRTLK